MRPGVVICAGGAGALVDSLLVGDVVIARSTVEHDYLNRCNERPMPLFAGYTRLVAVLAGVTGVPFNVHVGTVASGDEDIIETGRTALQQATGALAVAWEGAGGAQACQFSEVPFVELRGITDSAVATVAADFERHLALAMSNIATLLLRWLMPRSPTRLA